MTIQADLERTSSRAPRWEINGMIVRPVRD